MTALLDYLIERDAITNEQRQMLLDQLTLCSTNRPAQLSSPPSWKLIDREMTAVNPLAKRLFTIMLAKSTNLCVALDYTNCAEILEVVV